ncbi:MAG: dynamin family protein [Actinobacteria bacterium]|nr:dynamin family protein [Actinomycetota bacterium]
MSRVSGFAAQVRSAVQTAQRIYAGTREEDAVAEIARRLAEPLRVAIAGKVKAGKSTLLNALVGQELAPTDEGECTRVVWWFHDGVTYRVTVHTRDGRSRPVRFARDGGALQVDLEGVSPDDVERLEVEWPSQALRAMTLIDTPGIASATPSLSEAAQRFLIPGEDRSAPTDAVVYLMRHVHPADVRFLESFHDDEHAHATPVNTIAVLSRADELGVGRLDAMVSADRVAERYRNDARLRRLCQAVVPVAGLLAQAAVGLREEEFRALRRLRELPGDELDELLLSVDRFSSRPCPVDSGPRARLVRRLGIYGVRLALKEIGDGRGETSAQLAGTLLHNSGLDSLTGLLASQFTARRDLLKGRAALLALDALVERTAVTGSEHLDAEVERIQAGAHELAEVRLLNALRTGDVALRPAETQDAERLLGGQGMEMTTRLGLDGDASPADLAAAVGRALARWQQRAENPLAPFQAAEAARVVVRTCEGLAAELAGARPVAGEV